MYPQRLACIGLFFAGSAAAGINWKSVWLEPRGPLVMSVGETRTYTVMGRSGADTRADLTGSPELAIASSDSSILEIDAGRTAFIARKAGHVHIRISFGDATEMVPAFVRPPKPARSEAPGAAANDIDGIWKAVFTGPVGERPKMVSEIFFDVYAEGNVLTGTVHAAAWPGDAPIADGRIDGDRISFTMTGHLPFSAGRAGAMITGYPKLCFTGVRQGNQMKLDLLWSEAGMPCDDGRTRPMAGTKLAD